MTPDFAAVNQLFSRCLTWLADSSASSSPALSPAQNALLDYLRLDKIVEEEGFAVFIAAGYGAEILLGDTAEHLHRWQIPVTPKLMDAARAIYLECGREIEAAAGADADEIRAAFPQFAALDEEYFMNCEDDFPRVYRYVREHFDEFSGMLDCRTGEG